MKTTTTLLKTSLVGLFLTLVTATFAQQAPPNPSTPITVPGDLHIGTINDDATEVTPVTGAIFFYNPSGTSITLTASKTDVVTGLDYTEYVWHRVGRDGTPLSTEGETTGTLTLTNLTPGYYRYRVYGWIDDDGVVCQSDEYQDMIFFVLRPLSITSEAPTNAIQQFCLGEAPTDPLALTSTVTFDATVPYHTDGGFPNPENTSDFDLTYRWYAVNDQDPTNEIAIADPAAIDYNLFSAVGTYTFHVEVAYASTIKDRGTRAHAIWETQVMLNGGTGAYELEVTPRPGRPTITIEAITD